jgi:hypothetical protein
MFRSSLPLVGGCSEPTPRTAEAPAKPPAPAAPPEIEAVAKSVLGSEAEVLVLGDLAHTGRQQVLVVNRLAKTPTGIVPGTLVTRAVVVENDGGKWKEIFRCDEHLKNPNGFLGATPIAPVNGWRLQYEQSAEKGLLLFFTPLAQPGGGHIPTIGVRWNPQAKRYQSLDRNFEHFLGELASLEKFHSSLR